MLSKEDRQRFHNLLDYALDNDEDYVIMQFAQMDLDWHIKKETYRLSLKKDETFK